MTAAAGFLALPVTALAVVALLRTPLARRLVAAPSRDRWHSGVTPTFGGVAILAGFVAGIGALLATGYLTGSPELWGVLGGAGILFAAGLFDDLRSLPPLAKLAAQAGAAALVLSTGTSVDVIGNGVAAAIVGGLWLVAMTNAFNLLDNMDGLAATLAGVAALFFAIDATTVHPNSSALAIALALGAACAGFLPFNLRPRRSAALFMGDSGSQVLGFVLAALALTTSWKVAESTIATLLLPVLILAIPILDTALVTVIRLVEGRPVSQGGRDHSSHRLVYHGLSEKRAVVLLGLISAGLGGTSLAYSVLDDTWITLVGVLLTFAVLVQFAGFLAGVDAKGRPSRAGGPFLLRSLIDNRRRVIELVVDFALICASFAAAYLLRVEGSGTVQQRTIFSDALPAILVARFLVFIPVGLYRGVWRYAGAQDAVRIVLAVVGSEVLAYGYLSTRLGFDGFSLDIFVIDAILCALLVGAARFGERALVRVISNVRTRGTHRRTLIVGAGRGGRSLLRELRELPGEQVVGFVDDDPALRRRRLQGVLVLGGSDELESILSSARPDTVLVTIPGAEREVLDRLVAACASAGVPCRFVRRELDVDPRVVLGAAAE